MSCVFDLDPIYTVAEEFGTGLKFVFFAEPDEFETPHKHDEFSCKQAKKDEFQPGPKFVRYRVNRVLVQVVSRLKLCSVNRPL